MRCCSQQTMDHTKTPLLVADPEAAMPTSTPAPTPTPWVDRTLRSLLFITNCVVYALVFMTYHYAHMCNNYMDDHACAEAARHTEYAFCAVFVACFVTFARV